MNSRLKQIPDPHTNPAVDVVAAEAQEIAHLSADYQRAKGFRRSSLLETLTQRIDDLLFTMLDAFTGSVAPEDASTILREHHPLTEARLAKLPEEAVPLVVMRELISIHEIPLQRSKLANWGAFSERFQSALA